MKLTIEKSTIVGLLAISTAFAVGASSVADAGIKFKLPKFPKARTIPKPRPTPKPKQPVKKPDVFKSKKVPKTTKVPARIKLQRMESKRAAESLENRIPKLKLNPISAKVRPQDVNRSFTTSRQIKQNFSEKMSLKAKRDVGAAVHKSEQQAATQQSRLMKNQANKKALMQKNLLKKRAQKAATLRNKPGKSTYKRKLAKVKNPKWLNNRNSAMLPGQTAERLKGKKFKNFGQLRQAVWKDIANDPILKKQFKPSNIARMKKGLAPYTVGSQQRGGRKVYELDHYKEIRDGGGVYDLSNLRIKTPDAHIRKIGRDYWQSANAK